jgi:serine/threonine-protein kinase HipA
MKTLTIQALTQQQWHDIAILKLLSPEKGIASPSRLGYEFEYSVNWLETKLTRWGLL